MVDDIRDSFTTECVIQRNKHSWIAITALLSHHPLEEKMVMVVMCCGYHRLTSTQLMEYTPRNVFCPVRILMWLRPLPKLRALSSYLQHNSLWMKKIHSFTSPRIDKNIQDMDHHYFYKHSVHPVNNQSVEQSMLVIALHACMHAMTVLHTHCCTV